MLETKAYYFFEAGSDFLSSKPKELLEEDLELRCVIGYLLFQSVELNIKELSVVLIGDYERSHNIAWIAEPVSRELLRPERMQVFAEHNFEEILKLDPIFNFIEDNSRWLVSLAFEARYEGNVYFPYQNMLNFYEVTERLALWTKANMEHFVIFVRLEEDIEERRTNKENYKLRTQCLH